jgi:hypothetical protein
VSQRAGWSRDLTVQVAGRGVVSHTGSAALRLLADRSGLTAGLSRRWPAAGSPPGARPGPGADRCGGDCLCKPVLTRPWPVGVG